MLPIRLLQTAVCFAITQLNQLLFFRACATSTDASTRHTDPWPDLTRPSQNRWPLTRFQHWPMSSIDAHRMIELVSIGMEPTRMRIAPLSCWNMRSFSRNAQRRRNTLTRAVTYILGPWGSWPKKYLWGGVIVRFDPPPVKWHILSFKTVIG